MSTLVHHSPSALKRYREETGLSVDELARKTGISSNKLRVAEANETEVFKLSQLEKISEILFVPAVYLTTSDFYYQRKIPELIDFRNEDNIHQDSYAYFSLIQEFCSARENYLYVLETINETPKKFSLELTGNDAKHDARLIEKYFGFHTQKNKKYAKNDYYNSWRDIIENQDILVFEKSNDKYGSDGLSIYFEDAPVIVIFSSGQAPSRRLFTMIHELVHLGLKQSVFDGFLTISDYDIERYCDAVAGHVIAPEELINKYYSDSKSLGEIVDSIRKDIKASRPAIAIQLYITNKISRFELEEYLQFLEPPKPEQFAGLKKQYSVMNYYGNNFVQLVMNAMWQENISSAMAKNILGINDKSTPNAFNQLKDMVF